MAWAGGKKTITGVATAQQQPKPDAKDEQGEEKQPSSAEQKPEILPLLLFCYRFVAPAVLDVFL
jgi:hypothetical protein